MTGVSTSMIRHGLRSSGVSAGPGRNVFSRVEAQLPDGELLRSLAQSGMPRCEASGTRLRNGGLCSWPDAGGGSSPSGGAPVDWLLMTAMVDSSTGDGARL